MESNKIILISENSEFSNSLIEKLVLLRKIDEILDVTDSEFCDRINTLNPSLVFLVESEDREQTVQNLKLIKQHFKHSSVILVVLKKDFDFVLSMYDLGVCDFIFSDTHPAEILVKAIGTDKKGRLNFSRKDAM